VFFKIKFPASTAPARVETEAGLAAFASESEPAPAPAVAKATAATKSSGRGVEVAKLAIVIVATATVTASAALQYKRLLPGSGNLVIETSIPGQDVVVAGASVGRTPLTLSLKPGSYAVQVGHGELRRDMAVDLAAGTSIVRHIDMSAPQPAAPAVQTQKLRVQSESPASAVLVDGVDRGPTPIDVEGLAPGAHDVVIRVAGGNLRQRVTLHPGESTVMVFANPSKTAETAATPAAGSGGFLAVNTGVPVQIREGGRVIGASDLERQMLPIGEHTLDFVNEPLGYQTRKTIRIEAGKTTNVQLERVNGVLSVNAQPWAEVWIGGERIGQTPIGNLSRPIGTYDVVLRHPEFGERRERVTITTKGPARLGVDLRRK
jgi:hypothetical protein